MGQYADIIIDNINKFKNTLCAINYRKVFKDFWLDFNMLWDDTAYKYYINNTLSKTIFDLHSSNYIISCVFCTNLIKSADNKCGFICKEETYKDYAPLLPGTFSYGGNCCEDHDFSGTPWFFRSPCKNFQRLSSTNYFRNFKKLNGSVSTANYENIEGILFGISRNKRPCHICASVDSEIISQCIREDMSEKESPCFLARGIIASHYKPN